MLQSTNMYKSVDRQQVPCSYTKSKIHVMETKNCTVEAYAKYHTSDPLSMLTTKKSSTMNLLFNIELPNCLTLMVKHLDKS